MALFELSKIEAFPELASGVWDHLRVRANGDIVVFGATASGGSRTVAVSEDDGASWTTHATPLNASEFDVVDTGVNLVSVYRTDTATETARSTDSGKTWTAQVLVLNGSGTLPRGIANNSTGTVVAITDGSSSTFRSTDHGVTWGTVDTSSIAAQMRDITYAGGMFIATIESVFDDGIATSADGVSWSSTLQEQPRITATKKIGDALYANNAGSGSLLISTDLAITWNAVNGVTGAADFSVTGNTVTLATVVDGRLIGFASFVPSEVSAVGRVGKDATSTDAVSGMTNNIFIPLGEKPRDMFGSFVLTDKSLYRIASVPPTVVSLGDTISGLAGGHIEFTLELDPGVSFLNIATSGGTGELDVYACKDKPVDIDFNYPPDFHSYEVGNDELIEIAPASAGTYNILLTGYNPLQFDGVTFSVFTSDFWTGFRNSTESS